MSIRLILKSGQNQAELLRIRTVDGLPTAIADPLMQTIQSRLQGHLMAPFNQHVKM